jgi:hypothetical protein
MEVVVTGHNFESILPKDHPCHACFKLAYWFQRRRLLNNFPIGSYVKTMSADGGHFGPRSGSLNTILEVDHLRTIDDMFAILAYWFQRRRFLNILPIGSYVKTMSADGGHLGWRFGSLNIILKVDHSRTIHAMFALNWLTGFRGIFFKHFSHRVLC